MAVDTVSFVIHHDGKLLFHPVKTYVGGKTSYHLKYNGDYFSYFEIIGLVKDVNPNHVAQMYYRIPGKSLNDGLRAIYGDKETEEVKKLARKFVGFIEIYVQHKIVINEENVGLPYDNMHLRDKGKQTVGGKVTPEAKGKKKVYRKKKAVEYETDDDWEVASIDHMSDDDPDDEEVQLRLKLKNFYKQTKTKEKESALDDIGKGDESDQNMTQVENQKGEVPIGNEEPVVHSEVNDLLDECRHISGQRDLSGYDSHYDSDSEYKTSSSKSDDGETSCDDDLVEKTIRYPIFDTKLPWDKIEPVSGMRTGSVEEMHHLISCYAISQGYEIRFTKRDKTRLVGECAPGCTWRVRASWMQEEKSFQIKTLIKDHTCVKNYNCKLVTANWLAKQYADKIRDKPRTRIREMKADIKTTYKVEVSEDMCLRARKKAYIEIRSALRAHYSRLWDYGAELMRTNPGSSIFFKAQDRIDHSIPAMFERAYVCFDALKKGWLRGCRPVIGLDGCFLKTFVKGQLLTAVGRDGNNHMYPIAWAVVEGENYNSWTWFLQQLKDDLGNETGAGWTIITDRQKGLMPTIQELLPEAEHRCCARHIYANFRKEFSGVALRNLFWAAAKCGTNDEFLKIMDEIKANNVLAYEWLMKSEPSHWARCYFSSFSSCENVENNLSECFNAYILEARQKPIINMLEEIRQALMKRLCDKKEMLLKLSDPICPRIRKKLESNKEKFRNWYVINNGAGKFEVTFGNHGYIVHLTNRTCSCRLWQLSGIPCCHSIAAIYFIKDIPDNYVSSWLTVETSLMAYDFSLEPVSGERLWPKSECEVMLPPDNVRKPGRPKRARRKEAHENEGGRRNNQASNPGVITRKGRKMRCTNCGEVDHNARGCKKSRVENDPLLDKRRKQQRKRAHAPTTEASKAHHQAAYQYQAQYEGPPPETQSQPEAASLSQPVAAHTSGIDRMVAHGTIATNAPTTTWSYSKKDPTSPIKWNGRIIHTAASLSATRDAMARNLRKKNDVDFLVSSSAPPPTTQFKQPRKASKGSPMTAISMDTNRSSPRLAEKRKFQRLDLE